MSKNILTIKSIGLSKLNNAEYLTLMTRLYEEINKAEPSKIGITSDEAMSFIALVINFSDVFVQNRANANTESLHTLDQSREKIWLYILGVIHNAAKSPLVTEQQASKILTPSVKPYVSKTKIANEQKTQVIRGFLVDMEKSQNREQLTVLNLQTAISELGRTNEGYAETFAKRALEELDKLPNSKTLRKNIDEEYRYITQKAYAVNLTAPTEQSTIFITNINIFIDEANAAYRRRMAHGEKKAEDETLSEQK